MSDQMEAQPESSKVTLRDLYLYEKLYAEPLAGYEKLRPVRDSMKDEVDAAIRETKERGLTAFVHFSQRPVMEARQIFEHISIPLVAFEVGGFDVGAMDCRSLFLFGVISEEANDTAARIHEAHGLILKTGEDLRTYRRLTQMGARPIPERPSRTDLVSIVAQIEKGRRTGTDEGFDLDDPSPTPLSPKGIDELLRLGKQYRQIDNDVSTGRKARSVNVDDATLLELFQMLSDKLGDDERKIDYFLSHGRERIAVLRQSGAARAQL